MSDDHLTVVSSASQEPTPERIREEGSRIRTPGRGDRSRWVPAQAGGDGPPPPTSNRGVATPPKPEGKIRQGLDYLTFTMPGVTQRTRGGVEELCAHHFGTTRTAESWRHGYAGFDVADTGQLLWRTRKVKGQDVQDGLLNLPGRALDTLRGRGWTEQRILTACREMGFQCSRIDLSRDVYDKRIHPGLFLESIMSGDYVSTSLLWDVDRSFFIPIHVHQSGKKGVRPKPGESMTVYVGSRTSSHFLRVYDKKRQIEATAGVQMDHCTRVELEVKGARERIETVDGTYAVQPAAAELLARRYEEGGANIIAGELRRFIRFVKPEASRVERCPDVWWWKSITREELAEDLGLQRGISSPETSLQWLEAAVAPTIAAALQSGEADRIGKMVRDAQARISAKTAERWGEHERKKQQRKGGKGGDSK